MEVPVDKGGEEAWRRGIFLPENIEFTQRHDKDFLDGVTLLGGTGLTFVGRDRFVRETAFPAPVPERGGWKHVLYRRLKRRRLGPAGEGTIPVTLIPYFAWANRGLSYMEVWIPLARELR